jgi:hypothetical protein
MKGGQQLEWQVLVVASSILESWFIKPVKTTRFSWFTAKPVRLGFEN